MSETHSGGASPPHLHILVDTREQRPISGFYQYEGVSGVSHEKLDVGDYTTKISKESFVIERKSPEDMYNSILRGHKRFSRMLTRARQQNIVVYILVECPEQYFYSLAWCSFYPKVKKETIKKIVTKIRSYRGVHVDFCQGRSDMRNQILGLLDISDRVITMRRQGE